jgi:NAD-dependent deacetylase
MIEKAAAIVSKADIVVIVGTSMQVYPAAGLTHYVQRGVPVFLIDPNDVPAPNNVEIIRAKASKGMQILKEKLTQSYK